MMAILYKLRCACVYSILNAAYLIQELVAPKCLASIETRKKAGQFKHLLSLFLWKIIPILVFLRLILNIFITEFAGFLLGS